MDNLQLKSLLNKYITTYKGSYFKDNIPSKLGDSYAIILNLSLTKQPGTHWVSIVKCSNVLYYFDSLGNDPMLDKYLSKFLTSQNVPFFYNLKQIQSSESTVCGIYCAVFLALVKDLVSYKEYLTLFSNNLIRNDAIICKLFENNLGKSCEYYDLSY
jgi:hypothetical protein